MYYVRTFEGGGAFYDPRRQKYAEFKCDLCGHLHHVNLSQYPNYDLTKTFPCKKCGKLDKNDEINSLQTEKINLFKEIEQKKKRILEIENKIKELVPDSEFDFPSFVSEETKDFIRGTRLLTNQIIKSGKSKEFLVKAGIYNEDDSLTEKYI